MIDAPPSRLLPALHSQFFNFFHLPITALLSEALIAPSTSIVSINLPHQCMRQADMSPVLEARLEQASLLKKVVDAIKDLVQVCPLHLLRASLD